MSEVKRIFIVSTAATYTTNNSFIAVNITPGIAQGIDKDNRIGNKIRYRYLTLHLNCHANGVTPTAGPEVQLCRVVLCSARNVITAASDLMEDGVTGFITNVVSLATINVPLRPENANVVKDFSFMVAAEGNVGNNYESSVLNMPTSRHFNLSRRWIRNVTYKISTDALPTNPVDQIYLLLASAGGNGTVTWNWSGRLSFIDV